MDEYSDPEAIRRSLIEKKQEFANAQAKQEAVQNPRARLLDEAKAIVSKDRNTAYGPPEDNFRNIANLWNAYLGGKPKGLISTHGTGYITPMDVAMMMSLMKIARLSYNPTHRDSLVDAAGYVACAADIQESMQKSNPILTGAAQVPAFNPLIKT